MAPPFPINDFQIGDFLRPYIIAEIGVNHEGDIDLAKKLIDDAACAGANAAKFQSYKASKIASKHSPAYWALESEPTESQYKLFEKYDRFEPADYESLAVHCGRAGIDFLSTPFDLDAVDFLNPLVPAFKIASADITNVPLLRKCAATKKPLIMSTGAATLPEIQFAVETARSAGATMISLLHCVLNYPTPEEHAQLGMITVLQRVFPDCVIGYSDHVVPDDSLAPMEAAVLLGANILEKHFTHDKNLSGNDHYHAMDATDLKRLKAKIGKFQIIVSESGKDLAIEEAARKHARRSIVAARNIALGETLTEHNLIAKRPGHGISTLHWDDLIGRKTNQEVKEDELLAWNVLRPERPDDERK